MSKIKPRGIEVAYVPLSSIEVDGEQPRKNFDAVKAMKTLKEIINKVLP